MLDEVEPRPGFSNASHLRQRVGHMRNRAQRQVESTASNARMASSNRSPLSPASSTVVDNRPMRGSAIRLQTDEGSIARIFVTSGGVVGRIESGAESDLDDITA